jgi:hypothetical protein
MILLKTPWVDLWDDILQEVISASQLRPSIPSLNPPQARHWRGESRFAYYALFCLPPKHSLALWPCLDVQTSDRGKLCSPSV